jgi:hypothetical protein
VNEYEPPALRQTLIATVIALLVASVVLIGAVLPAEYAIDPTGVGGLLGLTELDPVAPIDANGADKETTEELQEYAGSWPTTRQLIHDGTGYASRDPTVVVVPIATANMVRFEAVLTWQDDNATGPQSTTTDTFNVQLAPPRRAPSAPVLARNDDAGAGMLSIDRQWLAPPMNATIAAASPDEALFALQDLHPPDHTGTGNWTLTIQVDPGQARVQGIEAPGTDDGNNYELQVYATTYTLDTNISATEARRLTREFELAPNAAVEFKMYLDANQSVEYAWNTSAGELYFDFHGDPAGGDGSNFVRHANGQQARDEATFIAPFDGTHGWYWQNTYTEPIRVTLTLRGSYVLV